MINKNNSFIFLNNSISVLTEYNFSMNTIIRPQGEDDPIVKQIKEGCFDEEKSLAFWLYFILKSPKKSVSIDCGSYTGLYSLVSCIRKDTFCIALEPSAVTFGRLVQNIQLNRFNTLILPMHLAASKSSGVTRLPHKYGLYNLCPGEALSRIEDVDHFETVQSEPLDALIHGNIDFASSKMYSSRFPIQNISIIKIDVEGAEMDVLKGADEIIEKYKPAFICESLNELAENKLKKYFRKHNYLTEKIDGERNIIALDARIMDHEVNNFNNFFDENIKKSPIIGVSGGQK